jgi:hypothetical protein
VECFGGRQAGAIGCHKTDIGAGGHPQSWCRGRRGCKRRGNGVDGHPQRCGRVVLLRGIGVGWRRIAKEVGEKA